MGSYILMVLLKVIIQGDKHISAGFPVLLNLTDINLATLPFFFFLGGGGGK